MAGVVGPADEAGAATIGISTAAARIADAVAKPVAGRAGGDAGAVGADIGSAALAARGAGAADRYAIAWCGNTGPILAHLVRTTTRHSGAAAAKATGIAATGAERVSLRARLFSIRTGGQTPIKG